ncbi:MAG TPA: hypothetical protein VFO11_12985, partial [Candidatus Polarisedimenticolaceae bacterium]|nr:hypothetical protein [Candidatus Polarisedimenticolaceae bacterium]
MALAALEALAASLIPMEHGKPPLAARKAYKESLHGGHVRFIVSALLLCFLWVPPASGATWVR